MQQYITNQTRDATNRLEVVDFYPASSEQVVHAQVTMTNVVEVLMVRVNYKMLMLNCHRITLLTRWTSVAPDTTIQLYIY